MIDCEFDTLILSLVLIWIFYVFNFILQLSNHIQYIYIIKLIGLFYSFLQLGLFYSFLQLHLNKEL